MEDDSIYFPVVLRNVLWNETAIEPYMFCPFVVLCCRFYPRFPVVFFSWSGLLLPLKCFFMLLMTVLVFLYVTENLHYLLSPLSLAFAELMQCSRLLCSSLSPMHPSNGAFVYPSLWRPIDSAVKYLHQKGITHRDIKLENILQSVSGPLKLCDFGSCVQVWTCTHQWIVITNPVRRWWCFFTCYIWESTWRVSVWPWWVISGITVKNAYRVFLRERAIICSVKFNFVLYGY